MIRKIMFAVDFYTNNIHEVKNKVSEVVKDEIFEGFKGEILMHSEPNKYQMQFSGEASKIDGFDYLEEKVLLKQFKVMESEKLINDLEKVHHTSN